MTNTCNDKKSEYFHLSGLWLDIKVSIYGYKQLELVMLKWLNATIKPWKQLQ